SDGIGDDRRGRPTSIPVPFVVKFRAGNPSRGAGGKVRPQKIAQAETLHMGLPYIHALVRGGILVVDLSEDPGKIGIAGTVYPGVQVSVAPSTMTAPKGIAHIKSIVAPDPGLGVDHPFLQGDQGVEDLKGGTGGLLG